MTADFVLTLPDAIAIAAVSLPIGASFIFGLWHFIPRRIPLIPHNICEDCTKVLKAPCTEHKYFTEEIASLKLSVEVSNRAIYTKLDTVSNELSRLCGYIEGKEGFHHDDATKNRKV